ncbi:MAG: Hsp20/alpha crystallin family protein [Candidatus Moranbacteria bacterium]|nr:Hsp20/alpha crystallin family protein [bacterium]MDP1833562.1 Hsp20/alpha crystallin family protein [Candidatus Moranbacteria bacterium]
MTRGLINFSPNFPFRDFDKILEEGMWSGTDFTPAIDVYQDNDNVIVEAPLAGVDPAKVDITIENDVLTISGHAEDEKEVKREDYYRKEVRKGSFSRSVILPMSVKADAAEAHSEKGMLKIVIPKAEEVKPKKIAVKIK